MSKTFDLNTFTYERRAPKIKAYGKEFELPVRNGEFCDSLDAIDRTIADAAKAKITDPRIKTEELISTLRRGVALFIGEKDAEEIFPSEGQNENIDIDEITLFYRFLKDASLRNLAEYTKKYAPSVLRR